MTIDPIAAARQSLARAEARLLELRARTDGFFGERPYQIKVAPHEQLPEYTVFCFKLSEPVPREIDKLARQTAKALHRALHQLGPAAHSGGDEVLYALDQNCHKSRWRGIVPAVSARSMVAVDGRGGTHPATLHAPDWNPARREVTILVKDPHTLFTGKIQAEFYFAFAGLPALRGHSAVAVLQVQLQKVGDIVAAAELCTTADSEQTNALRASTRGSAAG